MYTRSFSPEEKIKIPDNYDGTSLLNPKPQELPKIGKEFPRSEMKISPSDNDVCCEECIHNIEECPKEVKENNIFSSLFSPIFGAPLSLDGLLKNFGIEELLLIGLGLFLLLSSSGDKECALILFALLLIKK